MKHIIGLLILIAASTVTLPAITPREAFVTAPRDVIVTIDSLTRLDMLDYYDSGSTIASRNKLGGASQVKLVTDDAITISTSGSSEITIRLLPVKGDTLIMVTGTLILPAPDSKLTLYDKGWTALGGKSRIPSHNDLSLWILPQFKSNIKEIEDIVPFVTAVYTYNDGIITMTHTLSKTLPTDNYKRVKPMLSPQISFRWTGTKWERI